ncbi:MAG: 1-deoxy-D-xylulose-5-phosphate reductoisomerase [Phycisphaerae bacterium]
MSIPKKRITILGSTGSIGRAALSVAENLPDRIDVVGLAAHSQWERLADQAARFLPRAVALADERYADDLRQRLAHGRHHPLVFAGPNALVELVRELDAEFVLAAVVGAAGVASTLAAIELGRTIGLANKEALVVAGALVNRLLPQTGATLIPVDSEHSAVFQALHSGRASEVHRIYLTASVGPFRTWTQEQMQYATLADALRHPTWQMGPKITIDSATMMNKALEIIEAKWLFGLAPEQIDVVIHPESIIHSLVQYADGSIIAQMGTPDMRTPVQYALTYPQRVPGCAAHLDLHALGRMHFEPPDPQRFPALRLGQAVARQGGTAGAALNAANEAAVAAFRAGQLHFCEIVPRVEEVLNRHPFTADPTLEELLAVDRWARQEVEACCSV